MITVRIMHKWYVGQFTKICFVKSCVSDILINIYKCRGVSILKRACSPVYFFIERGEQNVTCMSFQINKHIEGWTVAYIVNTFSSDHIIDFCQIVWSSLPLVGAISQRLVALLSQTSNMEPGVQFCVEYRKIFYRLWFQTLAWLCKCWPYPFDQGFHKRLTLFGFILFTQ